MLELDLHAEGQVPLFGERVYHLNDQVRDGAAGADPDDRSALSLHAEQGLAESAPQHGAQIWVWLAMAVCKGVGGVGACICRVSCGKAVILWTVILNWQCFLDGPKFPRNSREIPAIPKTLKYRINQ